MANTYPEGGPTASPQAAGRGPHVLVPLAHSLMIWSEGPEPSIKEWVTF